MITKLVTINPVTKASELVDLGYPLPKYNIGYELTYTRDDKTYEGIVLAFKLDVFLTEENEVSAHIVYELDNGDTVVEDEVDFYVD